MIAASVDELAPLTGTRAACAALAVPRASHYRRTSGPRHGPARPRPTPPRALSDPERAAVLDELHHERFRPGEALALRSKVMPSWSAGRDSSRTRRSSGPGGGRTGPRGSGRAVLDVMVDGELGDSANQVNVWKSNQANFDASGGSFLGARVTLFPHETTRCGGGESSHPYRW